MMRRLSGACLVVLLVAIPSAAVFAKPPDLPQDARIVVSPQDPRAQESLPVEPAVLESGEWRAFREGVEPTDEEPNPWSAALREMVSSSFFLEVHPFVAFWGDAGRQAPVPCQAPAETTSECPYMRQQGQCQPTRVINPSSQRSVMDNLRALEQAAKQMQEARQLAAEGRFVEALKCLEEVRGLCPGSSLDRQIEEACQEFISAADAQMEKPAAAEEEEPEGCCCGCCCPWTNQFGMCWICQFIDWCKAQAAQGNDKNDEVPANESCGGVKSAAPEALETLLENLVSLSFDGEALSKVLDEITFVHGMPFVIDRAALAEGGCLPPDQILIHLQVEQVSMKRALEMILARHRLEAEPKGCVIIVTMACPKSSNASEKGSSEPCEESSCPKMCGSVCPKCEALHAKHMKKAGVAEQVNGLMKACYLAIGEGRFEKAADLAREAYALDPARVEGDPIVYKLHLLAEGEQSGTQKGACPKSKCHKCCPTEEQAPACEDPGPSARPDLPDLSGDLPEALDEVLTGKDQLSEKAGKEQSLSLFGVSECCGVSLNEVSRFLQCWFLPPPVTEHDLHLTLGTGGIGVQGTVPFGGVNYTLYVQDGIFLVWMTPATTEK